jgi:hypothetical protein
MATKKETQKKNKKQTKRKHDNNIAGNSKRATRNFISHEFNKRMI